MRCLLGARRETERWVARAQMLARIPVDDTQEQRWLERLCRPQGFARPDDRLLAGSEHTMAQIRGIIRGPTVQSAGIAGTVLGLVAAAGEHLDHYRPASSREHYLTRTMLRPEPVKDRAERLALDVVGEDPDRFEERHQHELTEMAVS